MSLMEILNNTFKLVHQFTKAKFLSLSKPLCHKHAADALRQAYLHPENFLSYLQLSQWLDLPDPEQTPEALSNRYHYHLKEANLSLKEENFLPNITHLDILSDEPFLPIDIYLDSLRSMHNVGSIIRTCEAFRLGSVHLSKSMPTLSNEKMKKSAMGTETIVPIHDQSSLSNIRDPIIAIETSSSAISLYEYTFPASFSLLLGNEEYGLSEESVEAADVILEIPLQGSKNSINVASAFAVVASEVRRQAP